MRLLKAATWLFLPVSVALKEVRHDSDDVSADAGDSASALERGVTSVPADDGQVAAAPVKEVVRVLKALAKRADVRDRREKQIYEEFGSYCSKGDASLEKSLKESQSELPHLQLALVEAERKRQALQEEIKAHENDAAACKSALQTAQAIRSDEAQSYKKELATLTANQQRLEELLDAQDVGGKTLQEKTTESTGAEKSSKLIQMSDAASFQRLTLSASSTAELMEVLQAPDATAGQKIQVMEMLRNMLDGVKKDVKELKAQEAKRAAVFAAMEKAKTDELKSLQRSLQQKSERDAAFQKQMATVRMERQDTAAVVDDADKLGKSLQNWCDIRRSQHSSMQLELKDEQKALQGAAKLMLSGTDLEIFKPAPLVTFLQVVQRHEASQAEHRALRGKSSPALEKITKLVDSMVSVLEKAQEDDNLKIQMCKDETASAEDAKTALSEKAESKAADIATLSEQLETLERDVAAEKKAITRVDWVVATATKLREKEHKYLATSIAQGAAAVDVMHKAMNSLEKYLDEGGTLGGQKAKPDDEEFGFLLESASPGTDAKAALRSLQGVIEAVRAEVEQVRLREAADQAAYVQLIEVARKSRRKDAYTLTDFVGGQAALAAESQRIQDRQKALKEQMGLADQLASTLKEECEKLIADYKAKKQARIMEVDVLKNKKAALEASLADVDLE